jgi:hypothetical protein
VRVARVLRVLDALPAAPRLEPQQPWEPASKQYVDDALHGFPVGTVLPYAGTAPLPANWAVCDGTLGTPNLVGRFVKGAAAGAQHGQVGGAATRTLRAEHLARHAHGDTDEPLGQVATSQSAAHSHTGPELFHTGLRSEPGQDGVPIYWTQPPFRLHATGVDTNGFPTVTWPSGQRLRRHTDSPDSRANGGRDLSTRPNPAPEAEAAARTNALYATRHLTEAEKSRQPLSAPDHAHDVNLAHTHTTANAGGGQPVPIDPPHYTVLFIMRVQ